MPASDLYLSDSERDARHVGTVKTFGAVATYGFIRPDAGGRDVFFHVSAIARAHSAFRRNLAPGQRVEYSLTMTDKGKAAREVTPIDDVVQASA